MNVVVTGATSGLGRAPALGLAASGADLLLVGRERERGQGALAEAQAAGGGPRSGLLLYDLSAQSQVRELTSVLHERIDGLDVLINNARAESTSRSEKPRIPRAALGILSWPAGCGRRASG
jgi:3-oxoacyl-[acyl-carrier protein] reductase